MRMLVTGGAGFLGRNLVEEISKDNEVCVFDRYQKGLVLSGTQFIPFVGDILNKITLTACFRMFEPDIVVHLAANPNIEKGMSDISLDLNENLIGTFNLLTVMKEMNAKRIVFASSCSVYGNAGVDPVPEFWDKKTISLYGVSKSACEDYISTFCRSFGFESVIYRIGNVVGTGQWRGLIYDLLESYRKYEEFRIRGDGSQSRPYIYVSDVVSAFRHAMDYLIKRDYLSVFNLASIDAITVNEVVNIVEEVIGKKIERKTGYDRWPGDIDGIRLQMHKLKDSGWFPKYNSSESVRLATQELIEDTKV